MSHILIDSVFPSVHHFQCHSAFSAGIGQAAVLKQRDASLMIASPLQVDSESARDFARRSLDELFSVARQYRSSKAYRALLDFVAKFRFYAPFNAMLVHIQKPGATYVAPPHRWLQDYRRRIKVGARPLVILQPNGPVMFVFDVSDTEPQQGTPALPPEVDSPFGVRGGQIGRELEKTVENAKRDGVFVSDAELGSQRAGSIEMANPGKSMPVVVKSKPQLECVSVPVRYELLLNSSHTRETKYATLVHELAHLYCGHLGTPNADWWPSRTGLLHEVQEFEAESICYLVCARLGIENPSERYLASYWTKNGDGEVPPISLECVMKSAGLIEQMGRVRLEPRKNSKKS